MSDIWEAEHGFSTTDNGTLIPAQAPTADADGDGVSNIEECKAGTDPWSGVPTAGLFQAVFGPDPFDPAKSAVLWEGVTGKLYRVFMSPDVGTNWIQLGDPRIGTGGTIAQGISNDTPAEAYRFFYRVQAYDVDSDADGLNDHEEFLLGTNPDNWDENSNGLKDGWEVRYFGALGADPELDSDGDGLSNLKEHELGTNPVAADSDGDGIDDGAEEEFGLDPLNPDSDSDGTPDGQESFEPRWTGILRETSDYLGGGYDANNDGTIGYGEGGGEAKMYGRWPDGPYKKHLVDSPIPYPDLAPLLGDEEDGIPWPEPLPEQREEENIFSALGTATTFTGTPPPAAASPPTTFFASLQHRRNVVRVARPAEHDLQFRSLIRKRKTIGSVESPDEFEEQVATILEGERESTPVDLVPNFSGGGTTIADRTETVAHDQLRLIVEEISFSGDHYHELKSDIGGNAYSAPHWVDKDRDGFAKTHLIDGKPQPSTIAGERNYPVAFTRNTVVPSYAKVKGRFKITNLRPGETVKIRAKAVDRSSSPDPLPSDGPGLELPEKELIPSSDGTIIYPETESLEPLNSRIQFYNAVDETAFEIEWEVKVGDDTTWRTLASTKHTVFLTLKDPLLSQLGITGFRETIFWLACANVRNDTGSNINNLTRDIYKGSDSFSGKKIYRFSHVGGMPDKAPPARPLDFWGPTQKNPNNLYVHPLVLNFGVCKHWAEFLKEVFEVHGIQSEVIDISITSWKTGAGASTIPATVGKTGTGEKVWGVKGAVIRKAVGGEEWAFDPAMNRGQGVGYAKASWKGHKILRCGGNLYDPSYGVGPCSTPVIFENDGAEGYWAEHIDGGGSRAWKRASGDPAVLHYPP